jgi:hypothetical protein
MGLADDWKRLHDLDIKKDVIQYGQALDIEPGSAAPDLVLASKDLIRFVGEKYDINAFRIYLGPWQPKAAITTMPAIAAATYADPSPWAPPEPRIFDSMQDIPCYARVMWGAGMIQHMAFVDWPKRGALLQISGSYLQVNAFVDTQSPGASNANLPILQASLGPEPGGGDSSVPATFTYRPQNPIVFGAPDGAGLNFQIPPFARAFVPVFNFVRAQDAGVVIDIATQVLPLVIGATAQNEIQRWRTGAGGNYDPNFVIEPFPISGQQAGTVRIEFSPFGSLPLVPIFVGCMFLLDL